MLGAKICTSAATNAFAIIYNGKTVHYVNGIVFASRYTGSKTDATVGASFVAAAQLFGCNAVLRALVAILIFCGIAISRAHNVCMERN